MRYIVSILLLFSANTIFAQRMVGGVLDTKLVPSQTGNSGKYLTTDGTVTSWGSVSAPTLDMVISPDMDNSVRWVTATIGSGATVAFGTTGLEILTSATAGGNGRASYQATASYNYIPSTSNVEFGAIAAVELEGTNYQYFFGIGRPTTAATGLTMTDKNIGFEFQRSGGTTTLYASCGDATTQTQVSISGFSSGSDQIYQFIKYATDSVRFYLDGTYKTTIITNIPTGSTVCLFGMCASNRNTPSQTILDVSSMTFKRKFTP